MLILDHVCKTFLAGTPDERLAVDDLSLHLEKGDFVTIIGGNGAGKSTLFNLVCGTFAADDGSICLDGENISKQPEHRRAFHIGRLHQDPLKGTAPGMTIEENLSLAYLRNKRRGLRAGLSRHNRPIFREALSGLNLGLESRLKTRVGSLSGGQRQAIALLMSTMATPKLLLLDEHTAALDPATAERVMGLTRDIVSQGGITTMMITHNITQALTTGNRTWMMDEGRIVLDMREDERKGLSVADVMQLFHEKSRNKLENDRMLLS